MKTIRLLVAVLVLVACGDDDLTADAAAADAGETDSAVDGTTPDAGAMDASMAGDTGLDMAGGDAALELDASVDAALDMGADAGDDGGVDAGPSGCGVGGAVCAAGTFCDGPPEDRCAEAALASCAPAPGGCDDIFEPVCGCDGMDYGNVCEAQDAGTNNAGWGTCDRPIVDGGPCNDGGFPPTDLPHLTHVGPYYCVDGGPGPMDSRWHIVVECAADECPLTLTPYRSGRTPVPVVTCGERPIFRCADSGAGGSGGGVGPQYMCDSGVWLSRRTGAPLCE